MTESLLTTEEALENHRQALVQANARVRELIGERDMWERNARRLWREANAAERERDEERALRQAWQLRALRLRRGIRDWWRIDERMQRWRHLEQRMARMKRRGHNS